MNRQKNTQSSVSTYVGETIPMDLIIEILSRLPAKSIAVFRCVSKQWASLLERPDFTELFLKSSLSRPRLLFTFRIGSKWHFFSSPQPRNFDEKSVVATEYHMGYCRDRFMKICQSVNGFIGLKYWGMTDTVPVICNPCTGQHITLPNVTAKDSSLRSFFGYDPIGKQFKVLCIGKTRTTSEEHYQVLTLGTRELSWRKIQCSVKHYPRSEINGICINGVLYYIAWRWIEESLTMIIVCFDVRSEKFSFLEIKYSLYSTPIDYKGKLGVLLCFDYRTSLPEVWVLDDTKKVKWTKHTFVLPKSDLEAINSIWATDMGEIAWASNHWTNPLYVYYYNLERQSVRRVEIKGIQDKVLMGQDPPNYFFVFTNHVENLMFL